MCGLAGPLHGSANQVTLEFVKNVFDEVGEAASLEKVEGWIRDRLSKKELVYGFGHAVLRVEDPRATVLYDFIKDRLVSPPSSRSGAESPQRKSKNLKPISQCRCRFGDDVDSCRLSLP